MSIEIRQYPVIEELHEVKSTSQTIVDRIEGDILPAIHRQNNDIHDITAVLNQLDEKLNREIEVISWEQYQTNKKQKKFFMASIIYFILSTAAILYLFLR